MYEKGVRVRLRPKARRLWRASSTILPAIVETLFIALQTPGDHLSKYAAATQRGNVAYIPFPDFAAYATHGNGAVIDCSCEI